MQACQSHCSAEGPLFVCMYYLGADITNNGAKQTDHTVLLKFTPCQVTKHVTLFNVKNMQTLYSSSIFFNCLPYSGPRRGAAFLAFNRKETKR